MIVINSRIAIDESEIRESFIRSPGPGGQNVNKVATAVQLRFDVAHSAALPEDVRARLMQLASRRINSEGQLVIEAHEFRTQEQNRQAAKARLVQLIRQAAVKPKVRRPTKPTLASKKIRMESKRHRSELKQLRRAGRDQGLE
jgi:ribosome-associated protein